METLSLQASKILQEYIPENALCAHYLTIGGYRICEHSPQISEERKKNGYKDEYYKTLTLEGAIELLPSSYETTDIIEIYKRRREWCVDPIYTDFYFTGKTLLEAVEKTLLYLHKENLLGNTKDAKPVTKQ